MRIRNFSKCVLLRLFALCITVNAAVAESATIKAIQDRGSIRVALAEAYPAQFIDIADNEWKGMNVEMAKELASILDVKLEIVTTNFATIIPGLLNDNYDIIMADIFATPKRALVVSFSLPYNALGTSVVVAEDFPGTEWENLNDSSITIANLTGSAATEIIKLDMPKATRRDIVADNLYLLHAEVASGRADATITDHFTNLEYIKTNPDAGLKILGDIQKYPTGFAYAVRPNDTHFLQFLNTWIRYKETNGSLARLRKEWYGFD